MNELRQVGKITKRVVELFRIDVPIGTSILIGQTNIEHMINSHPDDYIKYNNNIDDIVNFPDYIAKNPNTGSIEFIKKFVVENDHVLVAARATCSGVFYIRSLYVMNPEKVINYKNKNYMLKY